MAPAELAARVMNDASEPGVPAARLTFSHGDPDTHRRAAADVRAAAHAVGKPVAVIGDLQGPKIRTGALDSSFMRLVRGGEVVLPALHRQEPHEIEISHVALIVSRPKGATGP